MNDFGIPQKWLMAASGLVALIVIVLIGLAARAAQSVGSETPGPAEIAAARPRPTVPPTFTPTATATVPASPTATATPSPTPTKTPTPAPTPIVVDVHELGYLTTVEYKFQTVAEVNRENQNVIQGLFGTDRVLLVAVGNVQAGIDMTAIPPENVRISGDRISLTIPHATISSVEMLPGESTVIDSQKKWAFSEYTGLETEAMEIARGQLREWAESEADILPTAETLAKLQLTDFLQKLGFRSVTISFTEGEK